MKNKIPFLLTIITMACSTMQAEESLHTANEISCSFRPDPESGKSGEDSCSYEPEFVFSSPNYSFPREEHCDEVLPSSANALDDFSINLGSGLVRWVEDEYPTPQSRQRMAEVVSEEFGLTVSTSPHDEFWEKFRKTRIAELKSVHQAFSHNFRDDVALIDVEKVEVLLLLFSTTADSNFSLYVPDPPEKSILTQYLLYHDRTWVTVKFGQCKIVK